MDTLDKVRFIESDAVPKEGASIKSLSTSIEITHACGCVLVEHFACGRTPRMVDETAERYERRQAERKYFIKLCPEHQVQFDEQISKTETDEKKELKVRFHHDDKSYFREFWEIFPRAIRSSPVLSSATPRDPAGRGVWPAASSMSRASRYPTRRRSSCAITNGKNICA